MRRYLAPAATATLLVAALTAPVAADTGPNRERSEFDRIQGSFAFSDDGRDFEGQILVQRDTETGLAITSFFYSWSGPEQECDNGTPEDPEDDYQGQDLIDFTANEAAPSTLTIASGLSSASASAVASGQLVTLEACTDAQTSTPTTVTWALQLSAVGHAQRSTEVSRFPNDDGTVTMQTIKDVVQPATGQISVDGQDLSLTGAALRHVLILETTK